MKKTLLTLGMALWVVTPVYAQQPAPTDRPVPVRGEIQELRKEREQEFETLRTNTRGEVEDLRNQIREEAEKIREEAQQRLENLTPEEAQTLRQEIQQRMENLREDVQNRIEEVRKNFQDTLEAKREEIRKEIETKREALRERIQDFRDERKKEVASRVEDNLPKVNEVATNQMTKALDQMSEVLGRIMTRAESAANRGLDVSSVETEMNNASVAIATARAAVLAQASKVYTVTVSNEDNLKSDLGTVRQTLHDDIQATRQIVRNAHDALRKAATTLAQVPGIHTDDSSDEATSSTE